MSFFLRLFLLFVEFNGEICFSLTAFNRRIIHVLCNGGL